MATIREVAAGNHQTLLVSRRDFPIVTKRKSGNNFYCFLIFLRRERLQKL